MLHEFVAMLGRLEAESNALNALVNMNIKCTEYCGHANERGKRGEREKAMGMVPRWFCFGNDLRGIFGQGCADTRIDASMFIQRYGRKGVGTIRTLQKGKGKRKLNEIFLILY